SDEQHDAQITGQLVGERRSIPVPRNAHHLLVHEKVSSAAKGTCTNDSLSGRDGSTKTVSPPRVFVLTPLARPFGVRWVLISSERSDAGTHSQSRAPAPFCQPAYRSSRLRPARRRAAGQLGIPPLSSWEVQSYDVRAGDLGPSAPTSSPDPAASWWPAPTPGGQGSRRR